MKTPLEQPQKDIFSQGCRLEQVTATKWLLIGERHSASIERDQSTELPTWLVLDSEDGRHSFASASSALAHAYHFATS